jgi:hypothetical protein
MIHYRPYTTTDHGRVPGYSCTVDEHQTTRIWAELCPDNIALGMEATWFTTCPDVIRGRVVYNVRTIKERGMYSAVPLALPLTRCTVDVVGAKLYKAARDRLDDPMRRTQSPMLMHWRYV